jgi:hypothetical protein
MTPPASRVLTGGLFLFWENSSRDRCPSVRFKRFRAALHAILAIPSKKAVEITLLNEF